MIKAQKSAWIYPVFTGATKRCFFNEGTSASFCGEKVLLKDIPADHITVYNPETDCQACKKKLDELEKGNVETKKEERDGK